MDWLPIILDAIKRVKATVKSLIGTSIAQESYGVGAGGDLQKHIDPKAERVIIEAMNDTIQTSP